MYRKGRLFFEEISLMINHKKGFTLIELLIVIGILAILAAAVIVVLNPAELLAQARDGQRFADLNSLQSALALYLADVSNPDLNFGATGVIRTSMATATCGLSTTCTLDNDVTVAGAGWVRVNLASTTGGSPVSVLPTDPTNDGTYHYAYAGDDVNDVWELNAVLESTKHSGDMTSDGGDDASWYEVGTDPGLDL